MIIKEKTSLKGIYKFIIATLETKKQWELHNKINQLIKSGENPIDLIRQLNSICKTKVIVKENIIPTVGRTLIANNLTSATPTNSMLINKAELGTGSTAPANTDTALETPSYRNDVASRTNADNIAYITAFFSATEVSGTFSEAGIYSDGTATLGSGILVSRFSVSITKTTS